MIQEQPHGSCPDGDTPSETDLANLAKGGGKFRSLAETFADWIWEVDTSGAYTHIGPRAHDVLGYETEELIGKPYFDLMPTAEAVRARAAFEAIVQQRKPFARLENAVISRSGQKLLLESSGVPVFARDGRLTGYLGADRDITAQKQAERQMGEEEGQFRALVEQEIAGIYMIASDGVLAYVNPRFAAMFGYAPAEVIGRPFTDFVADADRERVRHSATARLSGAELPGTLAFGMKRKDGTHADVLAQGALAFFLGRPAVIGVIIDVTEQKRVEASLRLSEAQLSNALAIARAAHWEYDVARDQFIFNDNFYRIFHTTAEQVGGYTMSSAEYARRFVYPDEISLVAREIQASIATNDCNYISELEHRIICADGAIGYVALRISVVKDATGRTVRAFGVSQDITERKRNEGTLRQVNRALRLLSTADAVLVQATDEQQLVNDMCRVIVENSSYPLAWIGAAQNDAAKSLRPIAYAGSEPGYLSKISVTWADDEKGSGPGGIAIKTGRTQINRNFGRDASMGPWRKPALEHGLASNIALPLGDNAKFRGILAIYSREPDAFQPEEVELLEELAGRLTYGLTALRDRKEREAAVERLQRSLSATVTALASTVESRDPYTAGHQHRVSVLASAIARELRIPEHEVQGIFFASVIHDIGKIRVPSDILSKPGKLTLIEFELIKSHVQAGYDIVKGIDFPWPVADMILQHHERLDGSGYPNGLRSEAILPGAKILAVADVAEAMMSHRPYRAALGLDRALAEIEEGKGRLFDPAAVDACLDLFRRQRFTFEEPLPSVPSSAHETAQHA